MKKSVILLVICFLALSFSIVSASQLKVTSEHPFLVNNEWIPASQLQVGDSLKTIDGKQVVIKNITEVDERVEVYNLHVNNVENYFANDVLVHNKLLIGLFTDDFGKVFEYTAANNLGKIGAVKRAAKEVPAYKKFLEEKGINPDEINIKNWEEMVPILDKEDLFPPGFNQETDLSRLCVGGNLKGVVFIFKSSGSSGKLFAYGVMTEKNVVFVRELADALFGDFFNTKAKKTIVINALSNVEFQTSLPTSSTGVKSDLVLNKVKGSCQQVIIVADPYFAAEIVRAGSKSGIKWENRDVSFVVGGQWFSNSHANYLKSKGAKNVIANMGASELGLALFYETPELARVRNLIQNNRAAMKALFGDQKASPEIMYYDPNRIFAEVINKGERGVGEMVVTTLQPEKEPMIRYNTHDLVMILTPSEFKQKLASHGIEANPEFNQPIVAVIGRDQKVNINGRMIMPQEVNEAIYRDVDLVDKITGYFKLTEEGIDIQLNQGEEAGPVKAMAGETLRNFFGFDIPVKVSPYSPPDWTRKFNFAG